MKIRARVTDLLHDGWCCGGRLLLDSLRLVEDRIGCKDDNILEN